jgi:hypothetical protein
MWIIPSGYPVEMRNIRWAMGKMPIRREKIRILTAPVILPLSEIF